MRRFSCCTVAGLLGKRASWSKYHDRKSKIMLHGTPLSHRDKTSQRNISCLFYFFFSLSNSLNVEVLDDLKKVSGHLYRGRE